MHVPFTRKVRTFLVSKVLLTTLGGLVKGVKTLRSRGFWAKVLIRLEGDALCQ